MLRMYQFKSGREMKDYYTAALAGGDYYLAEEKHSRWRGDLAKRLGLGEHVTQETFARLADNLHPLTGEDLTPRTNADRTNGYDINFSVPKSVSLVHAVTKDDRILTALRDSMDETMREIERQIQTRVRIGGKDENREANGLVWAEFLHSVGRPVEGKPDPQLHMHCIVFNATHDPVEDRIKAGQFRDIKRDMPYFEAAMHNRLAWRMKELGYPVERVGKAWQIAGVPISASDKFSNRTREIEKLAKKLGITDADRKAELGAKSRSKKTKGQTRDELRTEWISRLTTEERRAIKSVRTNRDLTEGIDERSAASRGLNHAIGDRFERDSVVAEPRLLESALRFGVGEFRPAALQTEANAHSDLLRRREGTLSLVTTRKVLAEERAMLAFARGGRGICASLEGTRPWTRSQSHLNKQQVRAVEHLLSSRDRVTLLRGGAGTGKTTLLKAVAREIESRGHKIVAVAPSADASRGTLRQSGFKDADTLAQFLGSAEMQGAAKGGVIWVDEAGMIGTNTMVKLFAAADRLDARIILCGDTKQHAPVERGDAMRLLETRLGLVPAELTDVVRQTGTYKEASEAIGRGEFDKGIEALDRMGAIREVEGRDHVPMVEDYMESLRLGRSTLVIAPTHAEGEQITSLIRAAMRRDGRLGQDDRLLPQLKDLRWTEAQRSDAALYGEGQIVQFHRSVGTGQQAFKAGQQYAVTGRDRQGNVQVKGKDGIERTLPLGRAANFSVNEEHRIRVASGESLRAASNGRSVDGKHRINNGAVYRVSGFASNGNLLLDNGWEVPPDFGRWSHGYVSTSHAAQGRTVDRVLLSLFGESKAATDALMYVSLTRGRESARVYTDDRRSIVQAAARLNERRSAVELLAGGSGSERSMLHAAMMARLTQSENQRQRSRQRVRTREYGYER